MTEPTTEQAALRDRIAEALADATGDRWPAQAFLTEADAVLAVLPAPADRAAEEAYRLALSTALRLGTGANWEAIRDRAEDLVAEVEQLTAAKRRLLDQQRPAAESAPADRAAVLDEAADDLAEFIALHGPTSRTVAGWRGAVGFLRRMAAEARGAQQDQARDHCLDNPLLTAQIGYPVRCPHCPPDAGPVPATHWTKHLQRHHPDAPAAPPQHAGGNADDCPAEPIA